MLMQHKLDSHATALQRGLADVNKRMDADKSARVCVRTTLFTTTRGCFCLCGSLPCGAF